PALHLSFTSYVIPRNSTHRRFGSYDSMLINNSSSKRLDDLDRFVDRGFNRLAQSHEPLFRTKRRRLTPYQQNPAEFAIHGFDHREHLHRVHTVGFHRHLIYWRALKLAQIRFDRIDRPRLAASRSRIDEDRHVLI